MDASELNANRTADSLTSQHGVMMRSLASAAIFGTIGATIGHWLGRNLTNKVVAPTLKWTMGTFWALVAAYSSFKAAEIERDATTVAATTAEVIPGHAMVASSMQPSAKAPLSLIEVDTLSRDGPLQETTPVQQR